MARIDDVNDGPVKEVEVIDPDALTEDDLLVNLDDDQFDVGDIVYWNCWPDEKLGRVVQVWTDNDGDDWVELEFDDDHKNVNVETYEVRKVYVGR